MLGTDQDGILKKARSHTSVHRQPDAVWDPLAKVIVPAAVVPSTENAAVRAVLSSVAEPPPLNPPVTCSVPSIKTEPVPASESSARGASNTPTDRTPAKFVWSRPAHATP